MNLGAFRKMRLVNLIVCLAFCLNLGLSGNALASVKTEKASASMLRPQSASDRAETAVLDMGIETLKNVLAAKGTGGLKAALVDKAKDKGIDPVEAAFIEQGLCVLEKAGKTYIICLVGERGWSVDLSQPEIKFDYFTSSEEREAFVSGGQLTYIAGNYDTLNENVPQLITDAQHETKKLLQTAGEEKRIFRDNGKLDDQVKQYSAERTSVKRQLPPLDSKKKEPEKLVQRLKAAFGFYESAIGAITQEDINSMMAIGLSPETKVKVGAEDFAVVDAILKGTAVGAVNISHLKEVGVTDSIVGHSAMRQTEIYDRSPAGSFNLVRIQPGYRSQDIAAKLKEAVDKKIRVTLCVGETLKIREADKNAVSFVLNQLETELGVLNLTGEQVLNLLEAVAYEPLWAINTGVSAQPEQIQEMHAAIRKWFSDKYGQDVAAKILIQYGGSVKPDNADKIFALADVNGALIGGASLKAIDFAKIALVAEAVALTTGKKMLVSANWKAEEPIKRDDMATHLKALAGAKLEYTAVNYYLPFTLLKEAKDVINNAKSLSLAEVMKDLGDPNRVNPAIIYEEDGNPSFYYKGKAGSPQYLAVIASSGGYKYPGYSFKKSGGKEPRSSYLSLDMVDSFMEMAKTDPGALAAYKKIVLHEYLELIAGVKFDRQESAEVRQLINQYTAKALDMWKAREAKKAAARLARENKKVVLEATIVNIAKFLDSKLDEVIPAELIETANQELQKVVESGLLTDYKVYANGGHLGIVSTRQNKNATEHDALILPAITKVCLEVLKKAKKMGIYQGEDLLNKSYLEQVRALEVRRPYVPLKYSERAADPFGVFWAGNTYVGAFNLLIWEIFSNPMYFAGGTIDPTAIGGFVFEVWDSVEDKVSRFDGETENTKLRALANQPGRYAIVAVYPKDERKVPSDEPVVIVSVKRVGDDGKIQVGDFSPIMIARSQSSLPAWGELLAPVGTTMSLLTYGGDKTKNIVAMRPTNIIQANKIPASQRKGLSLFTGFGFQSHGNGYFGITEDIGGHQTMKPARDNADKWARLFFGEPETDSTEPAATSILEKLKEQPQETVRVAINGGAGRIGTTVLRALYRDPTKKAKVVAINDAAFDFSSKEFTPATALQEYINMLYDDTVHHQFAPNIKKEDITWGKDIEASTGDTHYYIKIKDDKIYVYDGKDPVKLPWKQNDVDVVIEATGRFTDQESASKHITGGAKLVIISAPPKGSLPTLVMGVNQSMLNKGKDQVISNASCTTNCLAPIAALLQQAFGVKNGSMDTVHAYTNDQATVDLFRPGAPMRGKAAAENILPTSTGAAKAIGEVVPELKGKMDGIAERIPVADASMLILTVNLDTPTTKKEVNQLFKKAAGSVLKGILAYEEKAIASSSVIGRPESSIVIGDLTQVSADGKTVTVRAYYDNEFGYSNRLLDLAQYSKSALADAKEKEVLAKRKLIQLPAYMDHITKLEPFLRPHTYNRDDAVVKTRARLDSRFLRNPDLKGGEQDPLLQNRGEFATSTVKAKIGRSNIKADIGSVPGHYKPHRVTIKALNDIMEISKAYGFKGVNEFLSLTQALTIIRSGFTIDELVSKNGLYRKGDSEGTAVLNKINEFKQKTKITDWDGALAYLKSKTKDAALIDIITALKDAQISYAEFMDIVDADAMADALSYFTISDEKASEKRLALLSYMNGLTALSAKAIFDSNIPLRKALGLTTELAEADKILDFKIWSAGDDCQITMDHRRLAEDKLVHTLAWNALWYAADQTSYFKPYGWKQDILVDRLVSGNIQGAGPGYAEAQLRKGDSLAVFSSDKSAPGAFTVPILGMTRKARSEGRFQNGLFYEVWDINHKPRIFFYSENPQDMEDMLTLLGSPEEFAIKRVWEAKKKWDGKEAIEDVLDDIPLISASTERLVLTAGEYVGKDDPTLLVRTTKGGLTSEEVINIFQYPQVTLGFMRGSHVGPLVPGTQPAFFFGTDRPENYDSPEATPHLFDGPPPLTGWVFETDKPFSQATDAFKSMPWLAAAIEQGNFITQMLRRQGWNPPHKVEGPDTEYTTFPQVMEALEAEGRAKPGNNIEEAQLLKSALALQSKGVSHKVSDAVIGAARDAANRKIVLISSRVLRSDPSLILALQSINEQINQNLGVFESDKYVDANAYQWYLVVDDPSVKTTQDLDKLFDLIAKATNKGARASKDMFTKILIQEDNRSEEAKEEDSTIVGMYEGQITNVAAVLVQLSRMGVDPRQIKALVGSQDWTGNLTALTNELVPGLLRSRGEGLEDEATKKQPVLDVVTANVSSKESQIAFAANALFGAVELVATKDRQLVSSLAKKLELIQEGTSVAVESKGIATAIADVIESYRKQVESV